MKGFLYPFLILLFTNQTSAHLKEERERLCCLDFRPLMRMRDPGEPKPEVERCCFGVSCHFFSLSLSLSFICSEFCHTLKWNRHGFTCIPHPDPPSHLSLHPLPLGLPSAPGPSACLMHPTWAGDLFHCR